jgi:hypothetical protein
MTDSTNTETIDTETDVVEAPTEAEEAVADTTVTPYEAARVVNGWLKERGVTKELPQQMFYNYTQAKVNRGEKPMIPSNVDEDNKVHIEREALKDWFDNKYFPKNWAPKLAAAKAAADTEQDTPKPQEPAKKEAAKK